MTECVKVLVEVKPKEYLFFSADFSAQIYYILPIAIYWFWRKIRMIFFALGLVTSSFALVIRYLSTLASFSGNCNTYLLNTCSYVIDFITKVTGSCSAYISHTIYTGNDKGQKYEGNNYKEISWKFEKNRGSRLLFSR